MLFSGLEDRGSISSRDVFRVFTITSILPLGLTRPAI